LFFWYWSSQRTSPAGRLRRGVTWFDPNPQVYRTVIAASTNPAMSSRGNYIGFTSVGTGEFGEANGPGIADVFAVFGAPGSEAP
jgi:hypothetical protein